MFYALLDSISNSQSLPPALSMNCALIGDAHLRCPQLHQQHKGKWQQHRMHMSSSCLGC